MTLFSTKLNDEAMTITVLLVKRRYLETFLLKKSPFPEGAYFTDETYRWVYTSQNVYIIYKFFQKEKNYKCFN